MAMKCLSSGLRIAVTQSKSSSLQARSLTTAARQLSYAKVSRNSILLRPLQRWTPPTTTTTPATSLARRTYSIPSAPSPDLPPPNTPKKPSYELTFTCNPCGARSAHTISKQGYHHGSILISCPECRNRHVISDHLKIFGQNDRTIEDVLKQRGQLVKRGTLGEDGDVEFWEDGTTTLRSERQGDGEGQDPKVHVRKGGEGMKEGEVYGENFGKT